MGRNKIMAKFEEVELPNGFKLEDVPVGTSDAEIKTMAIKMGVAEASDFEPKPEVSMIDAIQNNSKERDIKRKAEQVAQAEKFSGEYMGDIGDAGDFVYENKFALGGGTAGSLLGPAGTIAGGAVGTALDTALKGGSGAMMALDTAISVVMDGLTMGATKFAPGMKAFIAKKIKGGMSPEALIKELNTSGVAGDIGTTKAAQQSQEFLQAGKADEFGELGSLDISRAADESLNGVQTVAAQIGENALSGRGVFKENLNRITNQVKNGLDVVFKKNSGQKITAEELGKHTSEIIKAGQHGLSVSYAKVTGRLMETLGTTKVSSKPLTEALDAWRLLPANVDKLGDSVITKEAMSVFTEIKNKYLIKNPLADQPASGLIGADGLALPMKNQPAKIERVIPAQHLLDFNKQLNERINSFKVFGSANYNPKAASQLTSLGKTMREAAHKQLSKVNPSVAGEFKALNSSYADSINAMVPDITESYLKATGKQGYAQIATMFDSAATVESIGAMKKSLKVAYKEMGPEDLEKIGSKNADEAWEKVQQRYIEKVIPSRGSRQLDPVEFQHEASRLGDADEFAKTQAILGNSVANGYKKIINTFATATHAPGASQGLLAMRSLEFKTIKESGPSILKGSGAVAQVLGLGIGVLMIPKMLAKYSLNPKRVNRLLNLQKMAIDSKGIMTANIKKSALYLFNDVYKSMDVMERGELMNEAKKLQD